MRIALLGATSQLGGDYAAQGAGKDDLTLFARDPAAAAVQMARRGFADAYPTRPLDAFAADEFDAVINCIGTGDPARALALGADFGDVTREWDDRVLKRLRPDARYVFLSSGAVYGDVFDAPIAPGTDALAGPLPESWYAHAKRDAEARHRAAADRSIIDLRIFNYIGPTQDLTLRYLLTDMIRAARDGIVFETTRAALTRDFLGPADLYRLMAAALAAPTGTNAPADAYSAAPIAKADLLALMAERFALDWRFAGGADTISPTGAKPHYHSLDRTAATWGYAPRHGSAEGVVAAASALLGGAQ